MTSWQYRSIEKTRMVPYDCAFEAWESVWRHSNVFGATSLVQELMRLQFAGMKEIQPLIPHPRWWRWAHTQRISGAVSFYVSSLRRSLIRRASRCPRCEPKATFVTAKHVYSCAVRHRPQVETSASRQTLDSNVSVWIFTTATDLIKSFCVTMFFSKEIYWKRVQDSGSLTRENQCHSPVCTYTYTCRHWCIYCKFFGFFCPTVFTCSTFSWQWSTIWSFTSFILLVWTARITAFANERTYIYHANKKIKKSSLKWTERRSESGCSPPPRFPFPSISSQHV